MKKYLWVSPILLVVGLLISSVFVSKAYAAISYNYVFASQMSGPIIGTHANDGYWYLYNNCWCDSGYPTLVSYSGETIGWTSAVTNSLITGADYQIWIYGFANYKTGSGSGSYLYLYAPGTPYVYQYIGLPDTTNTSWVSPGTFTANSPSYNFQFYHNSAGGYSDAMITYIRFDEIAPPPPVVSFNSSNTSVYTGQTYTLSLGTSSATSCSASTSGPSNTWSGNAGTSGSWSITPTVAGTYTHTITCSDDQGGESYGKSTSRSVTVTVTNLPVSDSLTTSATSINYGQSYTLTWSSTNATSCSASTSGPSNLWSGSVTTSGSVNLAPTQPGTYTHTLTCTGVGGSSAAKTVTVTMSVPPITVTSCKPSPTTGDTSTPITWSAQGVSGGTGSYTYSWTLSSGAFQSGTNSSSANPIVLYSNPGTYSGKVQVSSGGKSSAVTSCDSINITPQLLGNSNCFLYYNPRADSLISTPILQGIFGNNQGACVVGAFGAPQNQAALPTFQIPSYADLETEFYERSKLPPNQLHTISGNVDDSTVSVASVITPHLSQSDSLFHITGNLDFRNPINTSTPHTGVIFVDGAITIGPLSGGSNPNFSYGDNNSGLVLISKNGIYIDPSVYRVDGVLISTGIICTSSNGYQSCPVTTAPPVRNPLIINGSIISLGYDPNNQAATYIKFVRNLLDNTTAAEQIVSQPKYLGILRNIFSQTLEITTEGTNYAIDFP